MLEITTEISLFINSPVMNTDLMFSCLKLLQPWIPAVIGLRIDKGYQRGALNLARLFKTMIDVIIYYRYSKMVYFSLFNDVYLILIDHDLREL